ncbi:hypothetical protein Lesp02_14340 [Lentzea sp. NBRC 105346]|uniref:hypothetical protein n=1 Tax=Lentzea sp. NBRC 105346 TaxID=3032205 RepID=UPI0024A344F4|nr:hypothetical protein [Lentzea sp. NBRC 105346]GLZ29244.1 hypothetical protein Lesp02_14340 [Lentzea sp. NBRC 105346]
MVDQLGEPAGQDSRIGTCSDWLKTERALALAGRRRLRVLADHLGPLRRACGAAVERSVSSGRCVGALMNTRGLTELVILAVGPELGMLDGELYSLMVVMAVVTMMMTGPAMAILLRRSGGGIAQFANIDPVLIPARGRRRERLFRADR